MSRKRRGQSSRNPQQLSAAPGRAAFGRKEWALIQRLRTPRRVQEFLRKLPYNWDRPTTLRTFRGVVQHWKAHCSEAALAAATILEQHGYPPLLLDLESQDDLDHVLFLFRGKGGYGTVARSRDAGLHGRRPVFRTLRDLVMSYVDPFVDASGRITGYGVFDLRALRGCNWRLSTRNVWAVEQALIRAPHRKLKTSDRRYQTALRRYRAFRRKHPDRPVTYFANRHQWL